MIIRKAIKNDAEALAAYLLLAMEDIVYHFIGEKDVEKARAFLNHFTRIENNQYSYQNCWVAVKDNKVVAAANIYNGARLTELRQPVVDYIRSRLQKDFRPEDETEAGEYYLDTLGVDPKEQGKGIGSKLLQFLIREYVDKRGLVIGLMVEEENQVVKRLYFKLGFIPVGRKCLFGKRLEHLQISG